ncbi:ATP-binding cassette transporter snq2 [Stygiomarasmius scandens]|uniref:ATP-binding cassette transporter snq2 n=1 Tax=Marasmiellus scandens TaxID=2682957 RepID=A0ABR1K122_9AGAR
MGSITRLSTKPLCFQSISRILFIYEQQTAGQILCIASLYFVSLADMVMFSIFLLFIFTVRLVMKGFFRTLVAACTSEAVVQTFADIVILASSMYASYQIPKLMMIGALQWILYINRQGWTSIKFPPNILSLS